MPVLFLIVLVDLIGFGIVIPLLPFYAEHLGAGPLTVTLAMAVYSLAQFVTSPLWGRLSDRIGRRPVLLASLAGAVGAYLLLAWAPTLAMLFLARAAAGAMAGNIAAAQAYVADVTPPAERARGMGVIGAAFGLGFILGPAIGGTLAGHDPADIDFVAPALAAAGLSALALLGTVFLLPESLDPAHRGAGTRRGRAAAARDAFGRPRLAGPIAVGFVAVAVFAGMETTFALWSSRTFGWGPAQNGWLFAFVGVLGALVQGAAIGRLTPRLGEVRLLSAGLVLMAAGLGGIGLATAVPALFAAAAAVAVGFALASPSLSSLVSRAAGEDQGMMLGVYQSASSLARVLGPAAAGGAFAAIGKDAPFLLGALVLAILAAAATRLRAA